MKQDYGSVKALLMSGGGLRSYGWDVNGFVNRHGIRSALFVPYAAVESVDCADHGEVFSMWRPFIDGTAISDFDSMHSQSGRAVGEYDSVIATGGNTFLAIDSLRDSGKIQEVSEGVLGGSLAYMGISAGSGIACPTIQGTNDDPIIEPRGGFSGLGIVPFNVKPHYFEPVGQAESQDVRIQRYFAANENPNRVVGLPERTSLLVENGAVTYLGGSKEGDVLVFEKGKDPLRFGSGSDLSFLLDV